MPVEPLSRAPARIASVEIPSGSPGGTDAATGAALRDRVSAARSASDRGRTGTIADNVMPVVGGKLYGASAGHA